MFDDINLKYFKSVRLANFFYIKFGIKNTFRSLMCNSIYFNSIPS